MRLTIFDMRKGSGKTSLVSHLGAALAERGARVLVLDVEPAERLAHGIPVEDRGAVLDARGRLVLRPSTRENLSVLSGVGVWLEERGAASRITDLFDEYEWVLCDAGTPAAAASPVLALTDGFLLPFELTRDSMRTIPQALRLLVERRLERPAVRLEGLLRIDVTDPQVIGASERESARATFERILADHPEFCLTSSIPHDRALPFSGAASSRADARIPRPFAALAAELEDRVPALGVRGQEASPIGEVTSPAGESPVAETRRSGGVARWFRKAS